MRYDLFMAIYNVEKEELMKNELLEKYLKEHYVDGLLAKVINEIYNWSKTITSENKIKITEHSFEGLTKKMDKLLALELGEKDKEYFTKLLEKYLEEMLKRLQQVENAPEHKIFLGLLSKIEEKYTSPKLKETYKKAEERLGQNLQLEYKEQEENEEEKIEIKALSKLKKADIDYILTTQHKYQKTSVEKLIKYLIKKGKISTLFENKVNALTILKCRLELYTEGEMQEVRLDYGEKNALLNNDIEEIKKAFEVITDENDKKQIKNWFETIERTKNKEKEKEIENKQFNILLKELNKTIQKTERMEELVYDKTLNQMGEQRSTIEERKEINFYTFIEDKKYLELEEDKMLIQRDERFVLSKKQNNEGVLLETGRTIEKLEKMMKEKIQREGLLVIDNETMEEMITKLNQLFEKYEESRYSSRRKQWYFTGKQWRLMEVVVDYINKKAKHHNIEETTYKSEISEFVSLIVETEKEMVELMNEFIDIYGLKLDTEKKVKMYAIRKNEDTKYWYVKNFAKGFIESIEKIYEKKMSEQELKLIINKYFGPY